MSHDKKGGLVVSLLNFISTELLKLKQIFLLFVLTILTMGLLLPQHFTMPLEGSNEDSYNSKSFWFYPSGKSVTHKGVDIFTKEGTKLFSSTSGLVVYTGHIGMGGNVILVLGPKWRMHYYTHLNEIKASPYAWVSSGEQIGTVGSTGNAKGKASHLQYSIATPTP
jgi:peptidoglycan LD-endopeptidase LytH